MKVAIIGAGVLGTSLGILLRQAGYRVAAVCSPNRRTTHDARDLIGEGEVMGDNGLAPMGADLVILAVPDRAIPAVALEISAGGALKKGAIVVHLAGGLPASVLSGVTAAGGLRCAMHPLQSFADVETAVRLLPETHFFLEGDAEAVEVLSSVVVAIDGRPIALGTTDKALYHAGAVVASNFLVTLVEYAVGIFEAAGIPRATALESLMPLIKGTVANLEAVGLPEALTGPIARGDLGTVKRHLHALQNMPGDVARLYRHLARKTIEVALAKGSLVQEDAKRFLAILDGPDFPPEMI